MGIEDFKRWHWIIIGVLVGLALAYVWNGVEPGSLGRNDASDFIANVGRTDPKTEQPLVQSIVIQPPRQGAYGPVNVVTYKKLMHDSKAKKNVLVHRHFIAEIPFVPPGTRGTQVDPNMTVARYLDDLRRRHDFISYSNGWWTTKSATIAIWTIGSVLVIGGLWPIVLDGLVGAGMGRKREPKGEKFSLWKYKSGKSGAISPARATVTADEQRRVQAMADQLEANLAGAGVGLSAASSGSHPAAAPSAVRKLDGGPLEVAAPLTPSEEDEVEIKGEYYPVLIHHHKKHDDSHPPQQNHTS